MDTVVWRQSTRARYPARNADNHLHVGKQPFATPDMTFDIVAHAPQFPDLVLAQVLVHLPLRHVWALRDSASPDVRDLATRRLWLRVATYGSLDEALQVPTRYFDWMCAQNIPPPARIHELRYDQGLDLLLAFMTDGWRRYVQHYVDRLHLGINVTEENKNAVVASLPRLVEFTNLRLLEILPMDFEDLFDETFVSALRLPEGLKELDLCSEYNVSGDFGGLCLPSSVTLLLLCLDLSAPSQLPDLPSGLTKLFLMVSNMEDFSPYVSLLPRGLQELEVTNLLHESSAGILVEALQRLPRLLCRHNLMVVTSEPPDYSVVRHTCAYLYNERVSDDATEERAVEMQVQVDRIRLDILYPPSVNRLFLMRPQGFFNTDNEDEEDERAEEEVLREQVTAGLNRLFGTYQETQRLRVYSVGSADWEKITIPTNVTRLSWFVPEPISQTVLRHARLELLDLSKALLTGKCLHNLPALVNLSLYDCLFDRFEFPTGIAKLAIGHPETSIPKSLRHCLALKQLRLHLLTDTHQLDPTILPTCLKELEVTFRFHYADEERWAKYVAIWNRIIRPLRPAISLIHLTQLELLMLQVATFEKVSRLVLPPALQELTMLSTLPDFFDVARLPPTLTSLLVTNSDVVDPWSLYPAASIATRVLRAVLPGVLFRWVLAWFPLLCPPSPFPSSLTRLDLSLNRGLVSPPPWFSFPQLQRASFSSCGINSVALYNLPLSLRTLNLALNMLLDVAVALWPPRLNTLRLDRSCIDDEIYNRVARLTQAIIKD